MYIIYLVALHREEDEKGSGVEFNEALKNSIVYLQKYHVIPHIVDDQVRSLPIYSLSHPENNRDVTKRAKGKTLQDAAFYKFSLLFYYYYRL